MQRRRVCVPGLTACPPLQYVVDYASSRKILLLDTSTVAAPYKANEEATYEVHVDSLNLSGFKRSDVLNVGLLAAVLKSGDDEVIQINMVTQVMEIEGKLTRNVMSPLE